MRRVELKQAICPICGAPVVVGFMVITECMGCGSVMAEVPRLGKREDEPCDE